MFRKIITIEYFVVENSGCLFIYIKNYEDTKELKHFFFSQKLINGSNITST